MVTITFKTVVHCFAIFLIAGLFGCLLFIGDMSFAKHYAETHTCKPTPVRAAGALESVAVSEGAEKFTINLNELNQEKRK
ncbi:hypothetical protein QNH99_22735 (plasmid) [Pantoea allii]|uniref:hypothetical protein n=1 Tax=Pantoea TaxID=53335 RepID=UPI000B5A815B|nr:MULTISPECIES: hypothetical protein [Pantoea]MCV3301123.1 hypothetical protein [Pantoea ananatis]OWY74661.1 hypothetical protein CDN97_21845 [Pantoea sp. AMG 501]